MTQREALFQQALSLSPADQALLAFALEAHLADQIPPATAADEGIQGDDLLSELQRRSAAYRQGKTTARPAIEVMSDLQQRQRDESRP